MGRQGRRTGPCPALKQCPSKQRQCERRCLQASAPGAGTVRQCQAALLRQFRIFYHGEQPVGVALWALADELVAKRIDAGDKRLAAVEWKSGSNMRIVDIVAPFGGEAEMRGQVEIFSRR
jgi:glutathione S-transferase